MRLLLCKHALTDVDDVTAILAHCRRRAGQRIFQASPAVFTGFRSVMATEARVILVLHGLAVGHVVAVEAVHTDLGGVGPELPLPVLGFFRGHRHPRGVPPHSHGRGRGPARGHFDPRDLVLFLLRHIWRMSLGRPQHHI